MEGNEQENWEVPTVFVGKCVDGEYIPLDEDDTYNLDELLKSEEDPTLKYCPRCRKARPRSQFYTSRSPQHRDGLCIYCKECSIAKSRKRYRDPKARLKTLRRNYAATVKNKYGITLAAARKLWKGQGGRCACCDRGLEKIASGAPRSVRTPHIDHNHTNGKVRGILCPGCNTSIGKLGDNIEGVKKALAYLERAEGRIACIVTSEPSSN